MSIVSTLPSRRLQREPRDERDADTRADETLHRAVVIAAEDEARLGARAPDRRLDRLVASALPVADQRLLRDLAERGRLRAPGQRRVGRHDQHVRIDEQLSRLERRLVHRQHHEGEVDLAALEACLELVVDRGLRQLHVHLRELLLEAAHEGGEEPSADALVGADAKRARLALGERREVGLGCLHAGHDRLRVPQQEAHPPR